VASSASPSGRGIELGVERDARKHLARTIGASVTTRGLGYHPHLRVSCSHLEFADVREPDVSPINASYLAGLTNRIVLDAASLTEAMRKQLADDFSVGFGENPIAAVITDRRALLVFDDKAIGGNVRAAIQMPAGDARSGTQGRIQHDIGVLAISQLGGYERVEWQAIVDAIVVSLGGSRLIDT